MLFAPVASRLHRPALHSFERFLDAVGGHAAVRGAVVEDVALADRYRNADLPVDARLGRGSIAFRMYPEGPRQLVEGFTKNFAGGAGAIPWWRTLLIFIWITGLLVAEVSRTGRVSLAAFWARRARRLLPAAVLVLVEWRRDLFDGKRWAMLLAGALAVAAGSAIVDAARGLMPFAWILGNFEQNIVHNVSARYGTFPALSYVAWFMEVWSWWMVPAVIGILYGWRQAPGLLAAAAVTRPSPA